MLAKVKMLCYDGYNIVDEYYSYINIDYIISMRTYFLDNEKVGMIKLIDRVEYDIDIESFNYLLDLINKKD